LIKDKVVLYGFSQSPAREATGKISGPMFSPSPPTDQSLYYLASESRFEPFLAESTSNSATLMDADFNGMNRVLCQYRSITADGKIGTTNYGLELNGSIKKDLLFPDYLHPEDRAGFCVYLQNRQTTAKKVRLNVEFTGKDQVFYQTNKLTLEPDRDSSLRVIIPSALRQKGGFRTRVQLITYEFTSGQQHDVYVLPFDYRPATTSAVKVAKSYRVYGRELGSVVFPRSPVCHMEDIIRVTLKVRVRDMSWRGASATNDGNGLIVKDVIPSGCKVLISGPLASENYVENDRICFRVPEGVERTTLVYYLRAELPGRYAVYPALVTAGGAEYLTRRGRTPVGAVTVLF